MLPDKQYCCLFFTLCYPNFQSAYSTGAELINSWTLSQKMTTHWGKPQFYLPNFIAFRCQAISEVHCSHWFSYPVFHIQKYYNLHSNFSHKISNIQTQCSQLNFDPKGLVKVITKLYIILLECWVHWLKGHNGECIE